MIFRKTIKISTASEIEIVDITEDVKKVVKESGIKNGICHVFLPHASAALILNENESGLLSDFLKKISSCFPRGIGYEHDRIDDNANSHLGSGFIGQEKTLPVSNGILVRGTWLNLLVIELDGPISEREVIVTVIGE